MRNEGRTLILVSPVDSYGGITNYYNSIKEGFSKNVIYAYRGTRSGKYKKNPVVKAFWFFSDIFRFIWILITFDKIRIVQVTTSLDLASVMRDSIFIFISKLFRKKILIFFHGWSKARAISIEKCCLWFFIFTFKKANAFIILAKEVEEQLKSWGFKSPIHYETTVVEDSIFRYSKFSDKHQAYKKTNCFQVVFLARVEKYKGVYQLIDAIKLLKKNGENVHLKIVGDGSELESIKNSINDDLFDCISFSGYLKGADKAIALSMADLYILPSYAEGMPNSLLEAMGIGLPILTSKVGGIPDFFVEGEMGFFIDPYDSNDIAEKIKHCIQLCENDLREIGLKNYRYAKRNFSVNKVIERLEKIYSFYDIK